MELNPYDSPLVSPPARKRWRPWHRSIRWLLIAGTLLVCIYTIVWQEDPVTPAVVAIVLSALAAIDLQRMRKHNSAIGAAVGGAVGANLAVAMHYFLGYMMPEHFVLDDGGMGHPATVLVLAPYATASGVVIGLLVWMVMAPIFWITNQLVGR